VAPMMPTFHIKGLSLGELELARAPSCRILSFLGSRIPVMSPCFLEGYPQVCIKLKEAFAIPWPNAHALCRDPATINIGDYVKFWRDGR